MEVTSSGTTLDFETYDFDYFTEYITIEAVFATEGQTLDVAEVWVCLSRHHVPCFNSKGPFSWLAEAPCLMNGCTFEGVILVCLLRHRDFSPRGEAQRAVGRSS